MLEPKDICDCGHFVSDHFKGVGPCWCGPSYDRIDCFCAKFVTNRLTSQPSNVRLSPKEQSAVNLYDVAFYIEEQGVHGFEPENVESMARVIRRIADELRDSVRSW